MEELEKSWLQVKKKSIQERKNNCTTSYGWTRIVIIMYIVDLTKNVNIG